MKFSLLLKVLGLLISRAARKNQAFIKYIKPTVVKVLIRTEDRSVARLFIFNKGQVRSRSGDTADNDVALIWKDADVGFKTLTNKSPDASFQAAARGDFRVEGMSLYGQWFEDGMKLIL